MLKNTFSIGNFVDRYFSFLSRRSLFDRFMFHVVLAALFLSLFHLVLTVNAYYTTTVPSAGGTVVEGIVGTPRFVNPVLAITRADQDMVALIFSGLFRLNEWGELVPDIAESMSISEDGRTYTIQLRQDVRFHNNLPLTARDVTFTIGLIQNQDLKSPLRGNWDGVVVEEIDDYTITISLEEAYTPFIENLTVGILPRALWNELPIEQIPFSQNNTEPIGTGPYRVHNVLRTQTGLINAYQLNAFSDSYHTEPKIASLVFNFYQNEEQLLLALKERKVSGTPSLSTGALQSLNDGVYTIIERPLPRTFGIYFNQNRSVAMRDQSARQALSVALNRQAIIDDVLHGYGIPTTTPVPPGFLNVELPTTASSSPASDEEHGQRLEAARSILRDGGWSQDEDGSWSKTIASEETSLSITISTANTELFTQTAQHVARTWEELGVAVTLLQFEQTDLVQGIIRPRDFEAVLYGAEIGRGIDLYPFWHSSQKNDPGLNIAQYTNIDTDALLEKIRIGLDTKQRYDAVRSFEQIVQSEYPAIFLYTPTFGYVIDTEVYMNIPVRLSKPSERFTSIYDWHVQSNTVWPIFSPTNNLNN